MSPGFQHPLLNDAGWLTAEYEAKSIERIATEIGVSNTSVLRALRTHDIKRRTTNEGRPPIQHPLLADRTWLIEQYNSSSATTIARSIGVHLQTVLRAIRIHGIDRHTKSETERLLRRSELDDPDWLRRNYASRSMGAMAEELGVSEAAVHTAMMRHGVERRAARETQTLNRPSLLDDPERLAERLSTTTVPEIAAELGVAVPTVQVAMQRHGVPSPWKFDGWTRHQPPAPDELVRAWECEETIQGVARRFDVSANTAAVWLAQVGIFRSEVPTISKADLISAIERGDSIDVIRRVHRVTGRTVVVELHRHGLHEAHHLRHMRSTNFETGN